MDAIQLVKKDHRTVEGLFKAFERAARAEKAAEMRRLVREMTRELSVHAVIEEAILYPSLRRAAESAEDQVLEALEEHHLVKLTLAELEGMTRGDERYEAKVSVLVENVRHHVKEEEQELLPRLRKAFSPKDLRDLGDLMAQAKRAAPTRPHPSAPDTPPGNLVAGALAAILDRGRDMLRDAAEKGRRAMRSRARAATRRAKARGGKASQRTRATAAYLSGQDQPSVH
ncbi:MAG TPA: hemerythrin domain-containing protein [Anaeromyxobacteraceae bacterium]|nr:hemerythrin domain-containing protein [Anaeromyxobacteraceae bacterium]